MRLELLESYRRSMASNRLMQEAIDLAVEEPDYARWYLLNSAGSNEATVGRGTLAKDLIDDNAAEIRRQAFMLYYSSPFVRGIIRTLRKFIFGKGVTTTLLEEKAGRKKKAEEYLELWRDTNRWDLVEKESSDRAFRDGEVFWHNRWMGKKKVPRLEIIEPDDVCSDKDGASHGIQLEKNDPTTVKRYHIRQCQGMPDPIYIAGEDMHHIKLNADSNMKRGRSLLEPVFRYFKWHDDWLQSRIVLNKVRSAVALVRTVDGRQVEGEMIRKSSVTKNNPLATARRRAQTAKMFRSGSILTAGPGVSYQMLSANLGASDAAQDGRNILLAIAVGVGFPEMFLTGDFSNNNYSSSLTAQNPFVREFEDWQDFFDFHLRMEYKRVLELGIEAGLVDKGTSLKVKNEFPPLVYEDFVQMSTALGQLFLNEIISGHTYATRMGFDYDQEQELRQDELAQGGEEEGGFGGFGGGEEEEEESEEQPLLQDTTRDRPAQRLARRRKRLIEKVAARRSKAERKAS